MKFYKPRQSKYGISALELGESIVIDTPTPHDKRLVRRSAHNMNVRTDRHFSTRTQSTTALKVTRVR